MWCDKERLRKKNGLQEITIKKYIRVFIHL